MRSPRITVHIIAVSPAFDNHSKCEVKLLVMLNMYDIEVSSTIRYVIPSNIAADFIVGETWDAHFHPRAPLSTVAIPSPAPE